jgi:hypothetical protein
MWCYDGPPILNGFKILSIPFGPKVVLTISDTAIAPTNDDYKIVR